MRKLLRKLGKEHTVLLSTHILSEVESTCTRALVISKGKLVAEGTIRRDIRKLRSSRVFTLLVRGDAAKAESTLAGLELFAKVEVDAGDAPTLRCTWKPEAQPDEGAERAIAALISAGIAVRSAAREQGTLEDVFTELTTHRRDSAGAEK